MLCSLRTGTIFERAVHCNGRCSGVPHMPTNDVAGTSGAAVEALIQLRAPAQSESTPAPNTPPTSPPRPQTTTCLYLLYCNRPRQPPPHLRCVAAVALRRAGIHALPLYRIESVVKKVSRPGSFICFILHHQTQVIPNAAELNLTGLEPGLGSGPDRRGSPAQHVREKCS